ncbi:glycosyltransferase family 1 protein, partial [Erysipelatoclostridium ramosum]|uniref:glycosyltransferase n=1 Tax=Thomasclavelia ramosa TaxID=1547 RepID=UPI0034D6DE3A|nr:glycosyltransferase family 1 protein [Thomasclavelia ramosa]
MKDLLNSRNYTLVHTHTPISSLITRIAYKNSNIYKSCKMIYTAHGFHFYKGNNPLKNLIFRNIEKIGA